MHVTSAELETNGQEYPKYSNRQVCENTADPDQTSQNVASNQGLNDLSFSQANSEISLFTY